MKEQELINSNQKDVFSDIAIIPEDYIPEDALSLLEQLRSYNLYTYQHSLRVAALVKNFAKHLNLPPLEVSELYLAALLHDIGKVYTPVEILEKPGPLEKHEFEEIKKHPENSALIVERFESLAFLAPVIRAHHERYDGRGYPMGLKNRNIPIHARLIFVVDTFDAMTSTRSYGKIISIENALMIIESEKNKQFDETFASEFLNFIENLTKVPVPQVA